MAMKKKRFISQVKKDQETSLLKEFIPNQRS